MKGPRPVVRERVIVRARGLAAFRRALVDRALAGSFVERRRRVVILPTRASGEIFRQTLERIASSGPGQGLVLPVLATRDDLLQSLYDALHPAERFLPRLEREVIAARALREASLRHPVASPLVHARPPLVAAILDFYDELRRRLRGPRRFVRTLFRELAVERGTDRGSESLIQQTRLFGFTFLAYERGVRASGGLDEHGLRERLLAEQPRLPFDHVIIAVADHPVDPRGLWPSDFDLLGRLDHLPRLEVVVTDEAHDAGFRERLEQELPGIVEVRAPDVTSAPDLVRPDPAAETAPVFVCRDREEEVRSAARAIRRQAGDRDGHLDAPVALVFQRPLPYLYLAEHVLSDAGVPYQAFGALPLAAEPYAAVLDLVVTAVRTGRSAASVDALARSRALTFGGNAADALRALDAIGLDGSASSQIRGIAMFLRRHDSVPAGDEPWHERFHRGRRAILSALDDLADAFARADDRPRDAQALSIVIHHVLESRTFARRRADAGVHLVDAVSARFGEFDHVHVLGLVNGEWPERVRRSLFYAAPLLKALGWPQEPDQMRAEHAAFRDLLRLARRTTRLSAFQLESDALVALSPLVDLVARSAVSTVEAPPADGRPLFADEVLTQGGSVSGLDEDRAAWLALRRARPALTDRAYSGDVDRQSPRAYRVSRVDRYVDCPFKYFGETVLGLVEERPEVVGLTPIERGTLLHALFERFFRDWQRRGHGAITPENLADALEMFRAIASDALERLPAADAALERARLFGSIVGMGVAERVFELEADRGAEVRERRLETVLNGVFTFPRLHGLAERPIEIRGTADRVDVLADGSIAVVDYKLGRMPDLKSTVQIAVYAHCASRTLEAADGRPHPIRSATYLAFGDDRRLEGAIGGPGGLAGDAIAARVATFAHAVDDIESGHFPPRPRHPNDCQWCGYAGLCRKEYRSDVDDAAEAV
jgi:RecB family exonuclease